MLRAPGRCTTCRADGVLWHGSRVGARLYRHAVGVTWVEEGATARAAHALISAGRVWLVDPFDDEPALLAAAELGEPAGVLQLLDRHNRDCESLARELGVPLHRLPGRTSGTPFEAVAVISRRLWKEVALWWSRESVLIVAEALGTSPAFAVGRRAGVHPLLRLTPPRTQLAPFRPDRLLVGHGEPIESGAAAAITDAFDHSRSDIPRLLIKLPTMLRGG
jgi:hypothetical protein